MNNAPSPSPVDRTPMRRSLIIGLIGIPAVFAAIALGVSAWLWTSLPTVSGSRTLAGLSSAVKIVRDPAGVPHINAKTDADAYFALGYVHAQDRFWQMETMRRFGAGRLSEIMGEATLPADRWMRTLGLYRLAEQQAENLPGPIQQALLAYARGVNGWLATKPGLPAFELALFRYTPEPWKVADSLVWGKIMAMRLAGNFRTEILRARIARRIPIEQVGELWPTYPSGAPVSIGKVDAGGAQKVLAGLSALPPWPEGNPVGASNFWAIGKDKTNTGGALLANDPHLGFGAPIMWYLARIETPALQVTGATVPGVPFHILGQNRKIAWGITSTQADLEDLFVEKLIADDSSRYLTPDGSQAFDVRPETIRIKGAPDQVLNVRESRHGPVISDIRRDARMLTDDTHVVALSATYLQEGDLTSGAFYRLNRAKNWSMFQAALEWIQGPVINFAYADVAGNIGLKTPGLIPVRGDGSGVVPSPGWIGETDWQGFVPFNELPASFNPPDGRLANANNPIVGPEYPHFISHDWAARYRMERIDEILDGMPRSTLKQSLAMQNDTLSLMARDILPRLLTFVKAPREEDKAALALLRKWGGEMAREKPEPIIFSTWILKLNKALYSDELGELTPGYLNLRPRFLRSVLARRSHWCDDINTKSVEDCTFQVNLALRRAMDSLKDRFGGLPGSWKWGNVHKATFTHSLLTRVPLVNRLANLTIASSGGNYTLNRGATRPNNAAAPFAHIHGPGYRAVYDLSDVSNSRFMIATGQSGNPLSDHYSDLLAQWRDGKYLTLAKNVRTAQSKALTQALVLLPKAANRGKSK